MSTPKQLYPIIGLLLNALLLLGCSPVVTPLLTEPSETETLIPPQIDLQGHRGARGLRPENTLPAFEYALDLAVTTLELDLHLTQDGIIVVTHDDKIGKNCQQEDQTAPPIPSPKISQLTLTEVKTYQCNLNPNPGRFPDQNPQAMALSGENYTIPTLAELFQFVEDYADSAIKTNKQRQEAGEVRFNLETKRKADNPASIGDNFDGETPGLFETKIVALIEQYDLVERVTIQSFDHRSINVIPQLNPAIETVALTAWPVTPAEISHQTSAKIWSPDYRELTPATIVAAHKTGLKVIPWTVNDPQDMESLIKQGVDGLITDYPDILVDILDKQGIEY